MERAKGRSTIREMARRVGKWMVFLYSIISAGLYAPDDTYACRGFADFCSESLTLKHGAWIASFIAKIRSNTDNCLSNLRSSWSSFRNYCRLPTWRIYQNKETLRNIHNWTLPLLSSSELFLREHVLAWDFIYFTAVFLYWDYRMVLYHFFASLRLLSPSSGSSICGESKLGRVQIEDERIRPLVS
jgi:hypothetical protein